MYRLKMSKVAPVLYTFVGNKPISNQKLEIIDHDENNK
jgi:hypothetical protein